MSAGSGHGVSTPKSGLSSTYAPRVGLYLSGAASNYVSAPDSAGLSITGDIDLRWKGALTSYASGSAQALLSKFHTTSDQRSWYLGLASTGHPQLVFSTDGTLAAVQTATATATTGVSNGATTWLRATLDVDNGASGWTATFYKSTDGTTWSQIGSTVTTAGAISMYDSTAVVIVGAYIGGGSGMAAGTHLAAQVRNGIGGALVGSWDGTWPHVRQVDTAGVVWTVNGTANGWIAL